MHERDLGVSSDSLFSYLATIQNIQCIGKENYIYPGNLRAKYESNNLRTHRVMCLLQLLQCFL